MGTTQPIRTEHELKKFTDYYRLEHPSARNYALIIFSLNTALRISDLLSLKWDDVYDFDSKTIVEHLRITEKKTGKSTVIALNTHVVYALKLYIQERTPAKDEFVFTKNTSFSVPLSRTTAYRIIKKAADETIHQPNISCHSLRKTFGYFAWKQGIPPALLMDIYNHSSYSYTKRYLGIEQDERDAVFLEIQL